MTNCTVRLLLWKHADMKAGAFPIFIAITSNRKITYISTKYKIPQKYWNDKTKEVMAPYPNFKSLNIDLRKKISDIEKIIIEKSIEGKPVSGKIIKDEYIGVSNGKNFYSYAEDLKKDKDLAQVKGSRKNYDKEIARMKKFTGSYVSIQNIDPTFLRKYEAHERKRNMAQNTLNTSFKWLRTIITHAHSEKVITQNPFDSFTIPKYVQSNRTFLEKHERDAWVKFWKEEHMDRSLYNTLTYFLMGVFSGLRNSDWSNAFSMVSGDILRLRPIKTDKAANWIVLPIGPTLASIFAVVATLPPPISSRKTRDNLKVLANMLKTTKNITTHVARHSFGTMCAENGIPKSVTAELMAVQVETVDIYYHLTGESIAEQAGILRSI